jgi:hypothetical protein
MIFRPLNILTCVNLDAESAISATWESKIPVAHNIFAPRTGHTASVIGQQLEQIWVVGGNTKDINAPNLQQLDLSMKLSVFCRLDW